MKRGAWLSSGSLISFHELLVERVFQKKKTLVPSLEISGSQTSKWIMELGELNSVSPTVKLGMLWGGSPALNIHNTIAWCEVQAENQWMSVQKPHSVLRHPVWSLSLQERRHVESRFYQLHPKIIEENKQTKTICIISHKSPKRHLPAAFNMWSDESFPSVSGCTASRQGDHRSVSWAISGISVDVIFSIM